MQLMFDGKADRFKSEKNMDQKTTLKLIETHWKKAAFLAFLIIASLNIGFHEIWRDEIQSWMQALASDSFLDLVKNMQFERHPHLWHTSLWIISKFTRSPIAMQIFHLVIASISALLILKHSPFPRLQKILLIFGYFFIYEYAAISRNYSMGILFILVYLALYTKRFQRPLLISLVLFFMAQTTAYGLLFSMCFVCVYIVELFSDKRKITFRLIISAMIYLCGVLLSFQQLKSPDVGLDNIAKLHLDPMLVLYTLDAVWKSYFPIPNFTLHYWNSNILSIGFLRIFFSIFLLLLTSLFFLRKPKVLFFFLLGTLGILAVMYQYHVFMYVRYSGHLYLFFIAALWMSYFYKDKINPLPFKKSSNRWKKWDYRFIITLLAVHVIAGLGASILEWATPFTASKATACYIQENNLENLYTIGDMDEPASSVAGQLQKKLYYPRRNDEGTFIIYRQKEKDRKTAWVLKKVHEISQMRKENLLLILNWQPNDTSGLKKLESFTKSVVRDETYHLYLVEYQKNQLDAPNTE
jgi:hypothetical protein